MNPLAQIAVMPTKLRYKLLVAFCLVSLLPILAGIYIVSIFLKYPFETSVDNLTTGSVVAIFSLLLSYLGYLTAQQITMPIAEAARVAGGIASGKLDEQADLKGADELEDLSRSLKQISKNAKELLDKVEKLAVKDKLTGLYNVNYIRERLDEEIQRAIHYQRPCSFAYFLLNHLDAYETRYGSEAANEVLKAVARIFDSQRTEFDRAARITKQEFVMILPDRNKKKAIEVVERIHKDASAMFSAKSALREAQLALCIGISENPIDGVKADQLYIKAQDRMKLAQVSGKSWEAFA